MKIFRVLLAVLFGLPAWAQTVSRFETEHSQFISVNFNGVKGSHYEIVSSTNLGGPFAPFSSPFTLINATTNFVLPMSQSGNKFFAMALVDPSFQVISLPPRGLGDTDARFLKIKVSASPYAGATISGIGIKVGVSNSPHTDAKVAVIAAYGYMDEACSIHASPYQLSDAQNNVTNGEVRSMPFVSKGVSTSLVIPPGQSRYIQLFGAPNWSSGTYTLTMVPDTAVSPLVPRSQVPGRVVWAPMTTPATTAYVWGNGCGIGNNLSTTRSYGP